jgi:hypothetical protein
MPIFQELFHKTEEKGTFLNSFYKIRQGHHKKTREEYLEKIRHKSVQ